MNRPLHTPRAKLVIAVAAVAVLSGCASVNLEQNLTSANTAASGFTDGQLTLARDQSERDALRQRASDLLAKPLSQKDAVQLALVNSPSLQAIVAQNWADASTAAQSGRIANPILSLERVRLGSETEIGRLLSFGLLDLLTLPTRKGIAEQRIKQTQLRLSSDVVDQVTQVRQAWVRAVAAQQTLTYTQQVVASAQASAELAKRMQAVGNFNKLDRVRQQAFYADTATQLASAQHQVTAAREELVRLLGLALRFAVGAGGGGQHGGAQKHGTSQTGRDRIHCHAPARTGKTRRSDRRRAWKVSAAAPVPVAPVPVAPVPVAPVPAPMPMPRRWRRPWPAPPPPRRW